MRELPEFLKGKDVRITRCNSKNPKLVIIGESHDLDDNVDPKILFYEIKPEYLFCERIWAGNELNYQEYLELAEKFRKAEDSEIYYQNGSFDEFVDDSLSRVDIPGEGYVGRAIREWFAENPETVFVGMDLPHCEERSDNIFERGSSSIEKLDGYLSLMLHEHGDKLTPEEYKKFEQLREWIYENESHRSRSAYEMCDFVKMLRKRFPVDVLFKAKVQNEFRKIEKMTYVFNMKREKKMGKTMAKYTAKSAKPSMGVVGSAHIRPASIIFPVLEKNSIPYIAIDIT